jgi:hypothetical protein
MPITGARFLERQQFFDGQRLVASDLQDLEAFHRQMRWLHNQSLHQPGIGSGYAVVGPAGASEVTIAPGYAIDALGREIVLVEPSVQPVPPVANDGFGQPVFYDLTVSYPDDRELDESETRDGICLPRGVVRLEEQPVFCWVRLGPPPDRQPIDGALKADLQSGLRIRLARAEVFNCVLKSPLSVAERRNARPPSQPYVACGHGSLADAQILSGELTSELPLLALHAVVDTAAAGFRTRPCYYANVTGARLVTGGGATYFIDGFSSTLVPDAQPLTQVVVEFIGAIVTVSGTAPPVKDIEEQIRRSWQIDWIGVEG